MNLFEFGFRLGHGHTKVTCVFSSIPFFLCEAYCKACALVTRRTRLVGDSGISVVAVGAEFDFFFFSCRKIFQGCRCKVYFGFALPV